MLSDSWSRTLADAYRLQYAVYWVTKVLNQQGLVMLPIVTEVRIAKYTVMLSQKHCLYGVCFAIFKL